MNNDPIEQIENITKKTNDFMEKKTRGAFSRYPLLFSLLSVFGIVLVVYGFESAIIYVPYLSNRPILIFFMGIALLIFTGSLYKKIDRHRE